MSDGNDHELINFIAATVETMREQMATKDDIRPARIPHGDYAGANGDERGPRQRRSQAA